MRVPRQGEQPALGDVDPRRRMATFDEIPRHELGAPGVPGCDALAVVSEHPRDPPHSTARVARPRPA